MENNSKKRLLEEAQELTEKQINNIIDSAEVEMETNGELTWTTSKLLIRALNQIKK